MKQILITTFLTLGLVVTSFGQTLPSPDASSLIKNVSTPVNLYTGVASIDVPLYTVEANNGAQVPVSLNYQTKGIKVSEIAGVAGLGWHLNAGGSITRVMRDEADESEAFTGNIDYTVLQDQGDYDTEKDLFYFSYPGGGGRFIFSGDINQSLQPTVCPEDSSAYQACILSCGPDPSCIYYQCAQTYSKPEYECTDWFYDDIKTLPLSDVKIIYYHNGDNDNSWVITDTYGTKYYFGETVASREITRVNTKVGTGSYDPNKEKEFVSTWHLTKIEYANQPTSKGITFNYSSKYTITEETEETWTRLNDVNPYTLHGADYDYTHKSEIDTRYLTSIVFPKGTVQFNYANRSDLTNGRRLTGINVFDHNSNAVYDIDLNQGYFDASDSYYINGVNTSCTGVKCKRLKLNGIDMNGYTVREFDYSNDKVYYTSPNYDRYELPPRDSYYYDHWGFYNGGIHHGADYKPYAYNHSPLLDGMDRGSNVYNQANILTKVTYPTGGYTAFTYGRNTKNGGVRIATVKDYDENDNVVGDKSYVYNDADENDGFDIEYIVRHSTDNNGHETEPYAHSHAQSLIFDLNGPMQGYEKMKEVDNNTGIEVTHYFTSNTGANSVTQARKYLWELDYNDLPSSGQVGSYTPHYRFEAPFVSPTLENYKRGLEYKTEVRDASGTLMSLTEHVYTTSAVQETLTNNNISLYSYDTDGGDDEYYYLIAEYFIKTKYLWLNNSINITYDETGTEALTTNTLYTYHGTYQSLPKNVEVRRTDTSGGEFWETKTDTYYPSDNTNISIIQSQTVLDQMVTDNMIGVPVQTETSIKIPGGSFKTSEASITTFSDQHGLIQPLQVYQLNLVEPDNSWNSSNFRDVMLYDYNADGLLYRETGVGGIRTEYTYDNYGYVTEQETYPGPSLSARTTTYTYEPLIGVKTVTDQNNYTTTHEYDSRLRLHAVRDNDGNIVKRYRYNYANESDNLSATLSITYHADGAIANRLHTFGLANLECPYGECKFAWNWGDGTSTDLSSQNQSVQHAYSSSGTYEVTATIINPEYDEPFTVSQNVVIGSDSWSISITGPTPSQICQETPATTSHIFDASSSGVSLILPHYTWDYKLSSNSNWINILTDSPSNLVSLPPAVLDLAGDYQLRVTISDEAGKLKSQIRTFEVDGISTTPTLYDFDDPNGSSDSHTFSVTKTGVTGFTVSDDQSWITISDITSDSFDVNVSDNSGGVYRTGTVTVTATEGCTFDIPISQESD